ncbi:hypothetical protein PQJ75_01205 [Rhodoplanes sp. TEM]|uniref:Uncharacterized protein n=1 Tax=Rhodoplanes tepidamans TaxID=200616 RepID=A0ABT5J9X6_RHOTP|nr:MULTISPECIES: hypothetical protein [Rhodoplanes]MDC7786292.1 hypothetical protein [Rhodoplanes tepidamans]MDC7982337.1 hypothetical protein [Rhodoplanes sp. TEM]MDQ0355091.1 hypothetical protein [Rhodoplanes tepidamans]
MLDTVSKPASRRIAWSNVSTVLGAALLIGAEVFGAAFAGGWAVANLLGLGEYGAWGLQGILMLAGVAVMVQFVRMSRKVEPFTTRG